MDRHDAATGTVHWAPASLDVAEHDAVLPVASPPYWPSVQGKVERGVGYITRSFLEGRIFTDLDDLNAPITHWLATVANQRVHGTTKAVPAIRFADEQAVLRQASLVPVYDTRPIELRVAALDCPVSDRGVRYRVDPLAAGHTVTIQASGERVGDAFTITLGAVEVGAHQRRASGTPDVTLPAHAAAVRALTRGQSSAASATRPAGPASIVRTSCRRRWNARRWKRSTHSMRFVDSPRWSRRVPSRGMRRSPECRRP